MMKRTLWSTVAAALVAAALAIPVVAQPQGPGGPGGPGGRGGFGGFGGGRGGPLPMLRGLNLSDAQREQIRSIAQQQRGDATSPERKVGDLNKELHILRCWPTRPISRRSKSSRPRSRRQRPRH